MIKKISFALLFSSVVASAQITVAAKANLLFPTKSSKWKDITSTATSAYENGGKNNTGFNVGLSVKASLPGAFFIMPELYYTTFKTEYTETTTNTTLQAKSNRVDLPVLIGYNLLGENFGVFAGPVASYVLSTDDQYNDFQENVKNNFTIGMQFGGQIQFRKLILNARYEGAVTKDQRDFVATVAGTETTIRYDNRSSLFIVGLGYKF